LERLGRWQWRDYRQHRQARRDLAVPRQHRLQRQRLHRRRADQELTPAASVRCGRPPVSLPAGVFIRGFRPRTPAPKLCRPHTLPGSTRMVFRISLLLVIALAVVAGFAPKPFEAVSNGALAAVIQHAGWLYLLIVFLALVFLAYLAIGPLARLRIGGRDAEPEFSKPVWLSMLFAAGMGIGLVFWGAAEPVSHLLTPPEGLAPGTPQAARAAMRYTFFHWGLHPWAIYALMGLAIAWFQYNRNGRGLISDLLQPLIGDRHLGWIGKLVNIVAVVATAIGVATTLGFGTMQISAGMARVFGLPTGLGMQLAVIGGCFVLYMASSASGVDRGIKWLSSFNLILAGVLLLAVALLGPTAFIFDTFTTSLGSYLDHLVEMSLR